MILLAYGLLLGVLLCAGALVATSLPARGARIGLGAALVLACVVALTWLLAPFLRWSAALADGVWIIVLAVTVLGALGTALLARAVAPGWAWPAARDLATLGAVILTLGVVILLLPVPLDTDAQGFGYLALALRDGQDYASLAPWHPAIEYLYAPAYSGLIAHLSARFDLGLHTLMLIFSAATVVIFVWAAYDLGCELKGPRTGRGMLIAALGGTGLLTAFMDSHYTAVLALTFALAFLTFALRYLREGRWPDALWAAICLAGVPLSQPDTTIALIIGYVPWLVVLWIARPRPRFEVWLGLAVVIPLVALAWIAPWLLSIQDLLGSGIESPFVVASAHWRTLIVMHGGVIVLLSLVGAAVGLRRRDPAHLLALVWLVGIVEFSTLGLLERTFPTLLEPLLKYDYPFSLAWHGPIIPYTILGGTGLAWLAGKLGADRLIRAWAYPALALALVIVLGAAALFGPLVRLSKETPLRFYGAFSSRADVAAMEWLRDNAPIGARVLNHPGPHEGDWVPVISERDTVFFRPQPFFRGTDAVEAEQNALRGFWRDPLDPANTAWLRAAGVEYVIVPQVFGRPAVLKSLLRWRPPLPEATAYRAALVQQAPYLELVFEQDGAQVYVVRADAN